MEIDEGLGSSLSGGPFTPDGLKVQGKSGSHSKKSDSVDWGVASNEELGPTQR